MGREKSVFTISTLYTREIAILESYTIETEKKFIRGIYTISQSNICGRHILCGGSSDQ